MCDLAELGPRFQAVLQQNSLSYGTGHLGSPSSLLQFHIHLCALWGFVSPSHERAQAPFLPLELPCFFEVFIYLFHGSWEHGTGSGLRMGALALGCFPGVLGLRAHRRWRCSYTLSRDPGGRLGRQRPF